MVTIDDVIDPEDIAIYRALAGGEPRRVTDVGAADNSDAVGALIAGDYPLPPEARRPFAELQTGLSAARGEGSGEPPPAQQIDALLEALLGA